MQTLQVVYRLVYDTGGEKSRKDGSSDCNQYCYYSLYIIGPENNCTLDRIFNGSADSFG